MSIIGIYASQSWPKLLFFRILAYYVFTDDITIDKQGFMIALTYVLYYIFISSAVRNFFMDWLTTIQILDILNLK